MTIEDFISKLEIENEKKELLRKEVKRVISEAKTYNYKITNKDLIEHILFYIDSEVMFQISPNKDFKLPSLTDNKFDLKSLMNPDKDEDEDPKLENTRFILLECAVKLMVDHIVIYMKGFLAKKRLGRILKIFIVGQKRKV